MKFVILLVSLFVAKAHSQDEVDMSRLYPITLKIMESSEVKPYLDLAKQKFATENEDIDGAMMSQPEIELNCETRTRFCELNILYTYGWHADPFLTVQVVAQIKKDKVQKGPLEIAVGSQANHDNREYKDIKITSVTIGTPLATGKE